MFYSLVEHEKIWENWPSLTLEHLIYAQFDTILIIFYPLSLVNCLFRDKLFSITRNAKAIPEFPRHYDKIDITKVWETVIKITIASSATLYASRVYAIQPWIAILIFETKYHFLPTLLVSRSYRLYLYCLHSFSIPRCNQPWMRLRSMEAVMHMVMHHEIDDKSVQRS